MGILDRLRQSQPESRIDAPLAIMVILSSCIQYDGQVSDRELQKLRSILAWSPIYASNTSDEDDRIIEAADSLIERLGVNEAVDLAVRSLPNHLRTTAVCFAFDLVHADGNVEEDEKEFLSVIANKAGLPAEILDAIELVTFAKYTRA